MTTTTFVLVELTVIPSSWMLGLALFRWRNR